MAERLHQLFWTFACCPSRRVSWIDLRLHLPPCARPTRPSPASPPLQIALCLASFTLTSSPRLTVLCIASPLAPGWQTRMIGRHTLRMREPLAIVYSFGAATSDALRAGMVILG